MTRQLFEFCLYRLSMAFLLAYLLVLLPLRYRKSVSCLLAVVCFVVTGFLDIHTFFGISGTAHTVGMTLVQAALVQGTVLILCKYRDMRALFVGVSASTYVLAGNLSGSELHLLTGWAVPSLVVAALVHAAVLVFFIKFVRTNFLVEINATAAHWGGFTLVPLLIYITAYAVVSWPSSLYVTPTNFAAAAAVLVLMAVSYYILFDLLAQRRLDAELARQNEFLDAYTHSMRHELATLQQTEEELATTRHDMRHVYRLLDGCLAAGETDKARALIRERDEALEATRLQRFCRNATLNTVLSGCAGRAQKAQVTFNCQAAVPEQLRNTNEFELAIVLQNLLENALNAVATEQDPQNRWIKVRIFPVKEQLVLEITNHCGTPCPLSPDTGLPRSPKGEGHGYGLRSVQAFAAKNNAVFNIHTLPPQFRVRLMVRE